MNIIAKINADHPANQRIGFQRCSHISPSPERGTERFEYTLGEIDLSCDIEYTSPCRGSRECGIQMEPDEPEMAALCAAYVRDVDILELLSEDQVAEIEEAFLCEDRT